MRVLHILDHFTPSQSGYVSRTMLILDAENTLGIHNICLISNPSVVDTVNKINISKSTNTTVIYIINKHWISRISFIRYIYIMLYIYKNVRNITASYTIDVIHVHSPVINLLPILIFTKINKAIPVIYHIRAFWEDAALACNKSRNLFRHWIIRKLEKIACRHVKTVITLSQTMKCELLRRGIHPKSTTIIPNSVLPTFLNTHTLYNRATHMKCKINFPENDIIFGFIGSLYPYEGITELFHVFHQLRSANIKACLLIFGSGPESSLLEQYAASNPATIKLMGNCSFSNIDAAYLQYDILVYPRQSHPLTEITTPIKIVEALSLGISIFASDIQGHRDIVNMQHNKLQRNCKFFPAGNYNAITQLILDHMKSHKRDNLKDKMEVASEYFEILKHSDRTAGILGNVYSSIT